MEKVVLFIIAASALHAAAPRPERRYFFVYELKTWVEARDYCREKHTDLAVVDNPETAETLNSMADLSRMIYEEHSYRAWIGLHEDMSSWRWSLPGSSSGFRLWAPGEPNNGLLREVCTLMYDSGLWDDGLCDQSLHPVCIEVKGQDVRFVHIQEAMTWTEAQSYCRGHHTDLASVRDAEDNRMIKELIPAGQKVWIGLFRDSWKWVDGTNFSFIHWAANEPNGASETCATAYFEDSGRWEDVTCDRRTAFICYSDVALQQVVRVKLETTSSVDLNDAAVYEDLLQKIKLKLKDQGVKGDFKLSWRKQSDGKIFHKQEEKEEL